MIWTNLLKIIKNYNFILNSIKLLSQKTTLIIVTKNQELNKINLLINTKHFDFGENRVQEANLKWKNLISINSQLKLHLIGKLQSNKAKDAFNLFHYIHTLDNEKLAQIWPTEDYELAISRIGEIVEETDLFEGLRGA